jgi:hypothetical protein
MAPEQCKHPSRASGVVQLDFSRGTSDRAIYSAEVSVVVCEECGYIDLYAKSCRLLFDWLTKKS